MLEENGLPPACVEAPVVLELSTDLQFKDELNPLVIESVVKQTLAAECVTGAALSIVITDDENVRALNEEYRGVDETTDVLSFGMESAGDASFPLPPDAPRQLGEIIISFEQAQRQADEFGHTVGHEVSLLIVHGILHLLGYDHVTLEQQAVMMAREQALVEFSSLIERSLPEPE